MDTFICNLKGLHGLFDILFRGFSATVVGGPKTL